jgi:hypothetical protein
MNVDNIITSKELSYVIENDSTENIFRISVENLLLAINDWPLDLTEPTQLIYELKKEINIDLTFDNLDKYLKSLKPEKDAWKMEAISSLIELFELDGNTKIKKTTDLEQIINRLTEYCRTKIYH